MRIDEECAQILALRFGTDEEAAIADDETTIVSIACLYRVKQFPLNLHNWVDCLPRILCGAEFATQTVSARRTLLWLGSAAVAGGTTRAGAVSSSCTTSFHGGRLTIQF